MANVTLPARDVTVTHHLTAICVSITHIETPRANVSARKAGITQTAISATSTQENAA